VLGHVESRLVWIGLYPEYSDAMGVIQQFLYLRGRFDQMIAPTLGISLCHALLDCGPAFHKSCRWKDYADEGDNSRNLGSSRMRGVTVRTLLR
jgi:hypothetical protein